MSLSKHTIITPIKNSENYFIVNPLSGHADIVSEEEKFVLEKGLEFSGEFYKKGYLVDEAKEKKDFRLAYLDHSDIRETEEIQLFFVPNYACNFACTYCYQEGYEPVKQVLNEEVIDAFFSYVKTEFSNRKKYITVFGGEPLLPSEHQRKLITYLLKKSVEEKLDVAFVTNGYTLVDYIDLLKTASIREMQVTLDGTEKVHDARRFIKGKVPTFQRIVDGVDACLAAGISVNLRMVADKDNIGNLPELSKFAIEKGWTSNPLFKTQIGRNYELHYCNSTPDKLFDRASMYETIYELLQEYPYITEFYKPAFSIAKYISETGELPAPLFDSCPACKSEWAFDYTGTIYSCTATVGKKGEELGTYYPKVSKNESVIESWQERDVTSIPECKVCSMALACGGGCASVAKNKNGYVNSPDCRPIKELLSLGASYYFANELPEK